mgnify:CR=1 FL=1
MCLPKIGVAPSSSVNLETLCTCSPLLFRFASDKKKHGRIHIFPGEVHACGVHRVCVCVCVCARVYACNRVVVCLSLVRGPESFSRT